MKHSKTITSLPCAVLWPLVCMALVSCAKPPVKRYYTLVNEPAEAPGDFLPCDNSVVVSAVEVAAPYDEEKIIFRTDAYEVKRFNYRVWVSSPEEMLEGLLSRKLEKARVFKAVESFVNSARGHLTLYSRLNVIEEVDGEDGWNARLAMSFKLKSAGDAGVVWEHEFDETLAAEKETIESFLDALNKIYNTQADKMISSLARFVSSYPDCRPAEMTAVTEDSHQ